jgi:hypothetical protein
MTLNFFVKTYHYCNTKLAKISILYLILILLGTGCIRNRKKVLSKKEPVKILLPKGAIPFDYYDNELYINVKLNDSIEGDFIFDTGSDQLYLDSTFVSQHRLFESNSKRKKIFGVGVSAPTVPTISKIKLEFDSLVKDYKNVPIFNFRTMSKRKIAGVIGISMFKNRVLKINFDSNYLMVFKPAGFKAPKDGYDSTRLIIRINRTMIKCKAWVTDSVSIDGWVILDLGSAHGLTFTSIIANKYNFKKIITNQTSETLHNGGYGGMSHSYYFTGSELKISNLKLKRPVFNYSTDQKGALSWWGILGLLGNDVMDRFNLIFDFPQQKLYLKPNRQFHKPFYFPTSADSTKSTGARL